MGRLLWSKTLTFPLFGIIISSKGNDITLLDSFSLASREEVPAALKSFLRFKQNRELHEPHTGMEDLVRNYDVSSLVTWLKSLS